MKKSTVNKSKKAKSNTGPVNNTSNKPKKAKTKKAKSPNVIKKVSPQTNILTPNNFEEAYRTMGVGMTRAQFKKQF